MKVHLPGQLIPGEEVRKSSTTSLQIWNPILVGRRQGVLASGIMYVMSVKCSVTLEQVSLSLRKTKMCVLKMHFLIRFDSF